MAAYNTPLTWGALEMHEGTISHALLDESSASLESLRLAVTTGKARFCCISAEQTMITKFMAP